MSILSKIANSGKTLWIVLIVLGSLSVIIAGIIALLQYNDVTIRNGMQSYLHDKYGEDFKVTNIELVGSGLGIPGDLVGSASPVNDRDLMFKVGRNRSTNGYFDEYSGAIWTRAELSRLEPIIRDMFGRGTQITLNVRTIGTVRGDLDIRGAIPSFDVAAKMYGNKILYVLYIVSNKPVVQNSQQIYDFLKNYMNVGTDVHFNYGSYVDDHTLEGVVLDRADITSLTAAKDLAAYHKKWRVQ